MNTNKSLTRQHAIEALRRHFLQMVDEQHSICEVAARHGIFCHGFRRLSEDELRKKFHWIAGPRSGVSREKLEDVINAYLLARQEALEVPLACDSQLIDRDTCVGWDEFSDEDLERFCQEILGAEFHVVPDPAD